MHTDSQAGLKALADLTLIMSLPDGLRAAIDEALAKGASKREIVRRVQRTAGKRGLTVLAVEAYLGSRSAAQE